MKSNSPFWKHGGDPKTAISTRECDNGDDPSVGGLSSDEEEFIDNQYENSDSTEVSR